MTPSLSVVVIGLNEGANLDRCFASVRNALEKVGGGQLIYVDSGSTDDSVAIAHLRTDEVVQFKNTVGSQGLARNRGLNRVNTEFVQFVDGDTELDEDWFCGAFLPFADPLVACVVGNATRIPLTSTPWNRAYCLWLDTYKVVGEVRSPYQAPYQGGLFRADILRGIGAYAELRVPEEPELGHRILANGYKMIRVPAHMHYHRSKETFCDSVRRKRAYGQIYCTMSLHQDNPFYRQEWKRNLRALFSRVAVMIIAFVSLLVSPLIATAVVGICALLGLWRHRGVLRRYGLNSATLWYVGDQYLGLILIEAYLFAEIARSRGAKRRGKANSQ